MQTCLLSNKTILIRRQFYGNLRPRTQTLFLDGNVKLVSFAYWHEAIFYSLAWIFRDKRLYKVC